MTRFSNSAFVVLFIGLALVAAGCETTSTATPRQETAPTESVSDQDIASDDSSQETTEELAEDEESALQETESATDQTPVPTAEPTPVSTPTPDDETEEPSSPTPEEPATSGDIDLQLGQWVWREGFIGGLEVIGEVWNHGDVGADDVRILVTIRDLNGDVLASSQALTHTMLIGPESMTPFAAYLIDAPLDFDDVQIEIDGRSVRAPGLRIIQYHNQFDVLQATWQAGTFGNTVVGEIRNTGERSASLVEIIVAGYDANGALVMVDFTYAERDAIQPDQTSPFTVHFIDTSIPEPAELRVFVEGWAGD